LTPKVLYHGSSQRLDHLEPRQATGVGEARDQQHAVYATHSKVLAIAFAMRGVANSHGDLLWELKTDCDPPQIIYSAGTPRIGKTGFLYQFSSDGFEAVDDWQWVSKNKVLPITVEEFLVNDYLDWVKYSNTLSTTPDG
jgi:hypothetical protein